MPRSLRHYLIMLSMILCCPVLAAEPRKDGEQFTHTSWTSKDGVPGMVQSLAQTPDGYLWLGTYEGLYRFDGVSFDRIQPADGHPAGSIPVSALLVTREGELWVGYAGGAGVEILRHGRLIRGGMPNPPGEVTGLAQDAAGAVWVVGGRGRKALKRYEGGRWHSIGDDWGIPDDEAVSAVLPARDGSIWLASQKQIYFLARGGRRFRATGKMVSNGAGMAQDRAGTIWLSDASGTRPLSSKGPGGPDPNGPIAPVRAARRISLLFDRDGNLWGSTYTDGVFRITRRPDGTPDGEPVHFRAPGALTSNEAVSILEDREGNIWVATEMGLDQFRRANIESIPGLSVGSAAGYSITADGGGNVYIATGSDLYWSEPDGNPTLLAKFASEIQAVCRGRGGIWAAEKGRISHVEAGRVTRTLTWPDGKSVSGCGEDRAGLWLARPSGDILRHERGAWRKIQLPSRRTPLDIFIDWRGKIVGTLSRKSIIVYDGDRITTLSDKALGVAGLTVVYGNAKGLLIGGGTGLARWDGRRIQRLEIADQPWLRGIRAIMQTATGETWMLNNRGIIRVMTADLDRAFDKPTAPIEHDLYDELDGFNSRTQNSQSLQLAMGGDDRLWFLTRQGVLRVDPGRLQRNALPPPVAIKALIADGRRYPDPQNLKLASGLRNLSIQYTALSLAIPTRVRFRYRLRGFDSDWIDPGVRRQAFYTNLPPGTYAFEVVAANNDGVWNHKGRSLQFTIPPTFVQSRLFLAIILVAGAALLWLLYRLRLRNLASRMRVRLNERLAERERVAREVHDTLLQSIQALILRIQLATNEIPEDQPARQSLEKALDLADEVLAEGRNRVSDMRITESGDNLESMIDDTLQRLVFPPTTQLRVSTVGSPQALNLIAADEIARIANEAIFNIWRHAQATRVDIKVTFGSSELTVRFSDNGVGVPEEILRAGHRPGHFGLRGMRERAARLEGELVLKSSGATGTELTLTVPTKVAYAHPHKRWLKRFSGQEDDNG